MTYARKLSVILLNTKTQRLKDFNDNVNDNDNFFLGASLEIQLKIGQTLQFQAAFIQQEVHQSHNEDALFITPRLDVIPHNDDLLE